MYCDTILQQFIDITRIHISIYIITPLVVQICGVVYLLILLSLVVFEFVKLSLDHGKVAALTQIGHVRQAVIVAR